MTDETNGAVPTDAEDTAAVLSIASGEKTYLEPKAEEPKAEATTSDELGEDDAAAQPEPEAEAQAEPKPKKTAKERIDELTWQKRELERQNQALLDRLGGKQAPAQVAQQIPQGDGKPSPEGYEGGVYDPAYIEDLTDWKAEQAVTRRLEANKATETVRSKLSTFESKTGELYPDGEPDGLQAFRQLPVVPPVISEILMESDIGPKLAEHLGDNPREFERLSALPPHLQARELTQLENRLTAPATEPKPTPKTITAAPEPPPTARGAGGRFQVAADTTDFAAFESQYLKRGG